VSDAIRHKRPEPEWLTKQQLAARYQVTQTTVDNWRARHGLPWFAVGRVVRFRLRDVEAWERERTAAR
jgi:excisionase family DNA binding protein